nr:MAG TPA: hypothetical protein [Crassvirales sp.]
MAFVDITFSLRIVRQYFVILSQRFLRIMMILLEFNFVDVLLISF